MFLTRSQEPLVQSASVLHGWPAVPPHTPLASQTPLQQSSGELHASLSARHPVVPPPPQVRLSQRALQQSASSMQLAPSAPQLALPPQVPFTQRLLQQSWSVAQVPPSAPHSTVPAQVLVLSSQSPLQHSEES
jgi:hypothetical protein